LSGLFEDFVTDLFRKNWIPCLVAFLALCLFAVVSYSLWSEGKERFPRLAAGSYLGAVEGIFTEEGGAPVRLYVEAFPDRDDMLFLLLRSGSQPVLLAMASPGGGPGDQSFYFPPTITSGDLGLKLTGKLTEGGYFGGLAENTGNRNRGSWWLRPVREGSEETRRRESEVERWLAVRTEIDDVQSEIAFAEKRAPELKAEIEKLTDYVTEGRSLKVKADQKLALERESLRQAQEKLQGRQREAQLLESRIELSQRVTGMGKLVSLARETLDRERRWFDSMFSSGAAGADIEQAAAKAAELFDLKKAIALEEDRIARLLAAGRDREGL